MTGAKGHTVGALLKHRLILFSSAWLLIALVTRTAPMSAHEWSRLATVESLVERHTYMVDDSSFANTRNKIFNHGHFYSHQPSVLATIEAPVYWVIHAFGLRLSNNAPFDWAF